MAKSRVTPVPTARSRLGGLGQKPPAPPPPHPTRPEDFQVGGLAAYEVLRYRLAPYSPQELAAHLLPATASRAEQATFKAKLKMRLVRLQKRVGAKSLDELLLWAQAAGVEPLYVT